MTDSASTIMSPGFTIAKDPARSNTDHLISGPSPGRQGTEIGDQFLPENLGCFRNNIEAVLHAHGLKQEVGGKTLELRP